MNNYLEFSFIDNNKHGTVVWISCFAQLSHAILLLPLHSICPRRPNAGKSSNGQQFTDATGISPCCSSQHRIAGVPLSTLRVMAESGTARYFESVVVARCRLAGRGAPLHTLFYLRSARGKYLTNDIRLSRYKLLLTATLFQQHVRSFLTPSLISRWEGLFFPSVPLQFTNCLYFSFQSFQSASDRFLGCTKMYRNISN